MAQLLSTLIKWASPDEMIWTLDPTNPGTGAINILMEILLR